MPARLRDVLRDGQLLRLNFGIFALHAVQMAMFVVIPFALRETGSMPEAQHWKIYLPVMLGAFAFTLSVPLILLGNGLGALVLRQLTVGNIDKIKKYRYIKNGAMYSILFLGVIMVMNSFQFQIPEWLSPLITFFVFVYFFFLSII